VRGCYDGTVWLRSVTTVDLKLQKALLAVLKSLQASVDKQVDAITKQQEAEHKASETQRPILVRSKVNLPPEITAYYGTEQRERPSKARWEWVKRSVEFFGLLAAITLGILTYRTLQEVRSQAQAAREQVAIMQRQLEATDRPWIKIVGAQPDEDLVFFKTNNGKNPGTWATQGNVRISVTIENVGNSVALNVLGKGEMVTKNIGPEYLIDEQDRVCSGKVQTIPTIKQNIFPGERGDKLYFVGIDVFENARAGQAQSIQLMFIGCVMYAIPNSTTLHRSNFMYMLEHGDNNYPTVPDYTFQIGTRVPRDSLLLEPNYFSPVLNLKRSPFYAD
jgi:hypothetical protein